MKTESTILANQRETKCHEEKESRDRPWIFFLVFCWSSIIFVCCSFPQLCIWCEISFWSSPQNEDHNFRLLSVCHISSSTDCLYLIMSYSQWTLSCFYPTLTALTPFSFGFLLTVRTHQFTARMFLFLTRASLIILYLLLNNINFDFKKWTTK